MGLEVVAVLVALIAGGTVVAGKHPKGMGFTLAVVLVGIGIAGLTVRSSALQARADSHQGLLDGAPDLDRSADGFTSSETCRACHRGAYDSWHRSFHRTMTQLATTAAVRGDFDDVTLEFHERRYEMTRDDQGFWVKMIDPVWELRRGRRNLPIGDIASQPRKRYRVVMTTGSHHMQTYWVAAGDGQLHNLPLVYIFADARWVPREDVFLRPPDSPPLRQLWNDNCLQCHSTFGQPRRNKEGHFDTRVAELGIACEACHGPAEHHVATHRNPITRYLAHFDGRDDDTIVNPAKLDPARSAEVCGQCHSKGWLNDMSAFNREGLAFRPGKELGGSKTVVLPRSQPDHPWLQKSIEMNSGFTEQFFWSDGMVRVSGREYNGMVESKCFAGGEMSCVSCHSLHGGDPNLQLKPGAEGDLGCQGCHEDQGYASEEHTHHPPQSPGSSCVNCHMPYTSYGLLRALRSHLIDSPRAQASFDTGRPNACNGCHLDRTVSWTAEHLQSWYGIEAPSTAEPEVAASVRWLLSGDAGQRALAAWSYGWEPAQAASGTEWMVPILARALDDPYAAVRYIAAHALGEAADGYDYVAPADARAGQAEAVRRAWTGASSFAGRSELLMDDSGRLDAAAADALTNARDERRVDLKE